MINFLLKNSKITDQIVPIQIRYILKSYSMIGQKLFEEYTAISKQK